MSAPLKTYDLTIVNVSINGIRIQGFGEDAAITFEMASDDVEDSVGADGQVTASRTNDNRVYVDITCKENSAGCRDLGLLQFTQQQIPTFTRLPFLMSDPQTGEIITSQHTVFKTHPGPSKAKLAGERVFRLLLPQAKRSIKYAPLVAA